MIENLSQEFLQKYEGTYLNLKNKQGEMEPVLINTVSTIPSNESKDFLVSMKKLISNASISSRFSQLEFDYKYPKLGYILMDGGGLFFTSKKSDRQYKKGPCDSTLTFQSITYLVLNNLVRSTRKYGFNSIYPSLDDYQDKYRYISLFLPKFESVPLMLEKFLKTEDQIGVPLDHTWAVINSHNNKYEFLLYRELVPVGFIKMNLSYDDFSTEISELYFQEWSDFCQRKGLENVRIKCL